jgi:hypothetical protein
MSAQYRHNAKFVDALKVGRPLDREQRHRILWLAERAHCVNRSVVSFSTLHVLRVLLSFVGRKDGLCCPSITTLCDRCGCARATCVKSHQTAGTEIMTASLMTTKDPRLLAEPRQSRCRGTRPLTDEGVKVRCDWREVASGNLV